MTNEKGIVVIIEGPSGVGKDAVVRGLDEKYPNTFVKVPSITTRAMREGESQGSPYYFVDEKTFLSKLDAGEMFEYTVRHGQYRGMSKAFFDNVLNDKLFPVKDCDMVGFHALKEIYGKKVFTIFLTCPKAEIERRLTSRGDTGEDLQKRLNDYDEFIKNSVHFDVVIENIDLNLTIDKVYSAIKNFYDNLSD